MANDNSCKNTKMYVWATVRIQKSRHKNPYKCLSQDTYSLAKGIIYSCCPNMYPNFTYKNKGLLKNINIFKRLELYPPRIAYHK